MSGRVLALAVRPAKGVEMRLVERLELTPNQGVLGDHCTNRKRQVTLLDEAAWHEACEEAGCEGLEWTTRRAQVLVEGIQLDSLIGSTIGLGTAMVEVLGEVDPCWQMEEAAAGLEAAMVADCRGGVYCRIISSGVVLCGDSLS